MTEFSHATTPLLLRYGFLPPLQLFTLPHAPLVIAPACFFPFHPSFPRELPPERALTLPPFSENSSLPLPSHSSGSGSESQTSLFRILSSSDTTGSILSVDPAKNGRGILAVPCPFHPTLREPGRRTEFATRCQVNTPRYYHCLLHTPARQRGSFSQPVGTPCVLPQS